jgi:hypothetical protein
MVKMAQNDELRKKWRKTKTKYSKNFVSRAFGDL